jgi:hypothetical protein
MGTGIVSPGIKRPACEVHCLHRYGGKVKRERSCTSTLHVCLNGEEMDKCTFLLQTIVMFVVTAVEDQLVPTFRSVQTHETVGLSILIST